MRVSFFFALLVAVCFSQVDAIMTDADSFDFHVGDANASGAIGETTPNVTDLIFLSNYLYSGGPQPPCMNGADFDGDGRINNTDIVGLSNWMLASGPWLRGFTTFHVCGNCPNEEEEALYSQYVQCPLGVEPNGAQ